MLFRLDTSTMASYSYVETPNSNLVCCICRMPFMNPMTIRKCSHTFCNECIIQAISHSSHCPIDRSSLGVDELLPADPIVRSLVDELVVECPNHIAGCMATCQRQLLEWHLKDACDFVQVKCSEDSCDQVLLKKDVPNHQCKCAERVTAHEVCNVPQTSVSGKHEESDVVLSCKLCSADVTQSGLGAHHTLCPDFIIPCSQAANGCPWTGPRRDLCASHLSSCPYEAIKGFFPVNASRFSRLTEENAILKRKVDSLEGLLRNSNFEMKSVIAALGPWYRPDVVHSPLTNQTSVDLPSDFQPLSASSSRRFSYGNVSTQSPSFPSTLGPLPVSNLSPSSGSPDHLAPYFPHENQQQSAPIPNPADLYGRPNLTPLHRSSSSVTDFPELSCMYSQATKTSVAPVNLNTTLEGTLQGLRDSLVTLSTSVDSLARRNEIALANETLRLNEEIMSLRANIHGLRMQVHNVMMERNAQVTGRLSDFHSDGWQGPSRFHPSLGQASPLSATKL